jgi:hydrogenase maturation factor
MSLKRAQISVAPTFEVETPVGFGIVDVGLAKEHILELDLAGADNLQTYVIVHVGDSLDDIGSSSAFADFTWKDIFARELPTPRFCDYIRILIEQVPDGLAPDVAHPVNIVTTGSGIPSINYNATGPCDIQFIMPRNSGTPEIDSGTAAHIAVEVPAENAGRLKATLVIKLLADHP